MTFRSNHACRKFSELPSQNRRRVFFWPSIASSSETRCESSTATHVNSLTVKWGSRQPFLKMSTSLRKMMTL